MEKLRAYSLQDRGFDTIEANLRLGHEVDLRDYALPVAVLHFLEIRSVRLITNNPDKINAVLSAGIEIAERVGADVQGNPHSARYLATKRDKLGHLVISSPAASSGMPRLSSCALVTGRSNDAVVSLDRAFALPLSDAAKQ